MSKFDFVVFCYKLIQEIKKLDLSNIDQSLIDLKQTLKSRLKAIEEIETLKKS